MKKLTFIDLFAGAGGISCGLEKAGMKCLLGVDHDRHAMNTFALNHPTSLSFCGKIQDLTNQKIDALLQKQKVDLVIGGPPCQGFSTVGRGDPLDGRNSLFKEFLRVVRKVRPKYLIMENVTGLLAQKNADTLKSILRSIHRMGFKTDVQIMACEQFGVAERRRRTIIVGHPLDNDFVFPTPLNGPQSSPLKNLLGVGEFIFNIETNQGETHNHDILSSKLKSNLDLKRAKFIPEGRGIRYQKDQESLLPKRLYYDVNWDKLPEQRFRQTRLYRLHRNTPSPTIMTQRYAYLHPAEHRYLTAREAAAIQSFPNDFIFTGPISAQWRQIGNAVPPQLAYILGKQILKFDKQSQTVKAITSNNKKQTQKNNRLSYQKITLARQTAFIYGEKDTNKTS